MSRLNGNKLNMLVEGVAVKLVVLIQFNGGGKKWLAPVKTATPQIPVSSAHRLNPLSSQAEGARFFFLTQSEASAGAWSRTVSTQSISTGMAPQISRLSTKLSTRNLQLHWQPLVFKPFKNVGQFSKDRASHWHLPGGQEGHLSDLWLFCLYLRWRKSFYGMRGRRGQKYLRHAKSGVDTFLKTNVLIISTHQTPDTVKC